jgi:hypothetical protein
MPSERQLLKRAIECRAEAIASGLFRAADDGMATFGERSWTIPRLCLHDRRIHAIVLQVPSIVSRIRRNRRLGIAVAARSCAKGPLQPTANLAECGVFDGARPRVRRAPSSASRNEPSGGVENLFPGHCANEHRIQCRFGKSPLLPSEHTNIHVTIFVEGQCSERASYNACWLAADELDNEAGHTDVLPRQNLEGMLTWILQHPVKSRVGKAIGEKSTIRLRHGAALSRQRRKAVRRRPCASLAPFLVHSGAIPIDACQPQPKNHWF